jgi:hypothetical protein
MSRRRAKRAEKSLAPSARELSRHLILSRSTHSCDARQLGTCWIAVFDDQRGLFRPRRFGIEGYSDFATAGDLAGAGVAGNAEVGRVAIEYRRR